jgi:putative endonuclease
LRKKRNTTWYVYMVRCCDGTFYTGMTNDLDNRVRAHNAGEGAKYTNGRRPVELVYAETAGSKSAAASLEYRIKKLRRAKKALLVRDSECEVRSEK